MNLCERLNKKVGGKLGRKIVVGIVAYEAITKLFAPAYYFSLDRIVRENLNQAMISEVMPSRLNYLAFWRAGDIKQTRILIEQLQE